MLERIINAFKKSEEVIEEESFVLNRRKFFFMSAGLLALPKLELVKPETKVIKLKGISQVINYSIFDVDVNQSNSQFAYLQAKDLTKAIDQLLKKHDQELWKDNLVMFSRPKRRK